jgi:hypothetical protein
MRWSDRAGGRQAQMQEQAGINRSKLQEQRLASIPCPGLTHCSRRIQAFHKDKERASVAIVARVAKGVIRGVRATSTNKSTSIMQLVLAAHANVAAK